MTKPTCSACPWCSPRRCSARCTGTRGRSGTPSCPMPVLKGDVDGRAAEGRDRGSERLRGAVPAGRLRGRGLPGRHHRPDRRRGVGQHPAHPGTRRRCSHGREHGGQERQLPLRPTQPCGDHALTGGHHARARRGHPDVGAPDAAVDERLDRDDLPARRRPPAGRSHRRDRRGVLGLRGPRVGGRLLRRRPARYPSCGTPDGDRVRRRQRPAAAPPARAGRPRRAAVRRAVGADALPAPRRHVPPPPAHARSAAVQLGAHRRRPRVDPVPPRPPGDRGAGQPLGRTRPTTAP